MSSPISIDVFNYSGQTVVTKVTYTDSVAGNGSSINGISIANDSVMKGNVTVNTGTNNGKLTMQLLNQTGVVLAAYAITDLKNPENGSGSITITPTRGYLPTCNGYRSLPGEDPNIRYVALVVNQTPGGSSN
ncbi:MAG TPA: hypothetical protein VHI13_00650 [Candidatus Kapabacteria bacterium]|nr:hypothetical protein [Candidatus Kapabacteria bacterium]